MTSEHGTPSDGYTDPDDQMAAITRRASSTAVAVVGVVAVFALVAGAVWHFGFRGDSSTALGPQEWVAAYCDRMEEADSEFERAVGEYYERADEVSDGVAAFDQPFLDLSVAFNETGIGVLEARVDALRELGDPDLADTGTDLDDFADRRDQLLADYEQIIVDMRAVTDDLTQVDLDHPRLIDGVEELDEEWMQLSEEMGDWDRIPALPGVVDDERCEHHERTLTESESATAQARPDRIPVGEWATLYCATYRDAFDDVLTTESRYLNSVDRIASGELEPDQRHLDLAIDLVESFERFLVRSTEVLTEIGYPDIGAFDTFLESLERDTTATEDLLSSLEDVHHELNLLELDGLATLPTLSHLMNEFDEVVAVAIDERELPRSVGELYDEIERTAACVDG